VPLREGRVRAARRFRARVQSLDGRRGAVPGELLRQALQGGRAAGGCAGGGGGAAGGVAREDGGLTKSKL
jgi:hypothetical protein